MKRRIYCFYWLAAPLIVMSQACSEGSQMDTFGAEDRLPEWLEGSAGMQNDEIPELENISEVVQPSGSSLIVGYMQRDLQHKVSATYIDQQWQNMQTCLKTEADAPMVAVYPAFIENVTSDDILYDIQGRRLASSTLRNGEVNVVRISAYDYDGSLGNPGFHTRSILARYIWSINNLPPATYRTGCAVNGE